MNGIKKITFFLHSEEETALFARCLSDHLSFPTTIRLVGPLGVGKSAFARSFIKHHCQNTELTVPSPTFTLMQSYESPKVGQIIHCDFYRLEAPEDVLEIGYEEYLSQSILLIEWPEKIGPYIEENHLTLTFDYCPEDRERKVCFSFQSIRPKEVVFRKALIETVIDFYAQTQDTPLHEVKILDGDASNRIFYHFPKSIVMINQSIEEAKNVIEKASLIKDYGIKIPNINHENGQIVSVEDFGDQLIGSCLTETNKQAFYKASIDILAILQKPLQKPVDLVSYDPDLLCNQASLFVDYYAVEEEKESFKRLLKDLISNCWSNQPILIHRDFHFDNLILTDTDISMENIAVIDFQDAGFGPQFFDIASLLYCPRYPLSEEEISFYFSYFLETARFEKNNENFEKFYKLAILRNLRVIAIFTKLIQEGKTSYAPYLETSWKIADRLFKKPVLQPINEWYQKAVKK